ncbi:MAG: hypothetical protein APR54_03285 [Candidatus Cloacimonas sp. SDB]|nr:MAG: hypothetical protein APR54_03285 [Candidatus Cloacimonas sp. SDB]
MITVKLNGKEVKTNPGKTILEVAEENDLIIPTLCHDKELEPFGSCWVCAVKVEGRKGFVTACGTKIVDGMNITTDSEEVYSARKMALELLLSDHYADCEAPCKIACPNHLDVQTYVSLIANGQYKESLQVIKETLPMPLSIGRVCPAFCEDECRRKLVEEPIAIRQLKRYVADLDIEDENPFIPEKEAPKNEKIAIIGAGPSGLTCGYFLSNKGYNVTVFEAAEKAGGWLRYGIPEYRLPKKVLDKEIKLMCANGMKIKTGIQIGKDMTLSELSSKFDAVFLAIGAQNAVPMKLKGNDLNGCFLGVDFLKDFVLGNKIKIGKKVMVVGGGNTAIDCARTARRLGSDVTIVYRRTRKEMPAETYEIDAAEEEGIKFHFLTNPVENFGQKGKLVSVKLEKMKLGKPDASGRRRPEPTGEFFKEDFDTMIAAISQVSEINFLADKANKIDGKEIPLTRWSTAIIDEETMHVGIKNIFAGGDFRRGPATAIEAIYDGRIAAEAIDRYLRKEMLMDPVVLFDSKKEKKLKDVDPAHYKQYKRINRFKMPELEPEARNTNFLEIELGFSNEDATSEASRCLECGCQVNQTCKLREYATEYKIEVELFKGDKNKHPIDETHPFILRDPNKCIKCGRCVRICAEVQGPGVLGYIYRGFTSYVAPEFGESLTKTTCESCGKCIEVCPVGALLPRNLNYKLNPHPLEVVEQNCGLCGTGCEIRIQVQTDKIAYINPAGNEKLNDRNLCFDGKFGWQMLESDDRPITSYVRKEDTIDEVEESWVESNDFTEISQLIKNKLNNAKTRKIYVAPNATNEEILLMKTVAEKINAEIASLSYQKCFMSDLKNTVLMDKTYDDIKQAEVIIIVGKISSVLKTMIRNEQRKGKKLILINNNHEEFNRFADELYNEDPITDTLDRILENYYEEDEDMEENDTDSDSETILPLELNVPAKTLFLYCRENVSEEVAWNIWMLSSLICDFKAGSGVLQTSQFCNLKGLNRFGILPGKPQNSDFVIFYKELPCEEQKKLLKNSKFMISINTHIDESDPSHIFIPAPSYLEIEGSAIANDGRITSFKNPKKSRIFNNLLIKLYDLNLIDEEQSDPIYWLKEVKKELKKVEPKREMTDQQLLDYLYTLEDIKFNIPKLHNVQKIRLDTMKKLLRQ